MDIQDVLPRDAIPSIDEPSFGSEYFGDDEDEVIVVESDPPRAYPVRILSYHEIVNDRIDHSAVTDALTASFTNTDRTDLPIAVTWCPICASAVVYVSVVDGRVLTFGTSGKLADDALVMYDRETESEWKQPLGRDINGQFVEWTLDVIPSAMMSWQEFRTEYPDGLVLQPVHGTGSSSQHQSPRVAYDMTRYEEYDATEMFGLRAMRGEGPERTWEREDIDAKTTVLGIVHAGDAVGYPLPVVRDEGGVVSDTVGGLDVLVVATGGEIHAYENPGHQFELRAETLSADGTEWHPSTGRSSDGRQLTRLPARRLYAFAWQDDHGADSFYGFD